MLLKPIQVESYAGHKADETPRRFCWEDSWFDVIEVTDRWHQIRNDPEWPRADYFKVLGTDRRQYLLEHDLESGEWFLGRVW